MSVYYKSSTAGSPGRRKSKFSKSAFGLGGFSLNDDTASVKSGESVESKESSEKEFADAIHALVAKTAVETASDPVEIRK